MFTLNYVAPMWWLEVITRRSWQDERGVGRGVWVYATINDEWDFNL